MRYYIEDSGSRIVLASARLADQLQAVAQDLGVQLLLLEEVESQAEGVENKTGDVSDDKCYQADSPALILYTSGTTGPPKGTVLTHGNLVSQSSCLISSWAWSSNDSILHVLPLHHTHGIVNCLICPLTVGAHVLMLPAFNPVKVWNHLLASPPSVNVFMAVPTIYAKLLEKFRTDEMDK